jgi:anti-sigma B factor antagonist
MDEARRMLLAELQEFSLEEAVERLLELGVLDSTTLLSRRDEQLREWRSRSLERLGDELEALRRQAGQQRRHAVEQIEEARRQRQAAGAARDAIARLDRSRQRQVRRRHMDPEQLTKVGAALDAAHRSLGAALAALTLLAERDPYLPDEDVGALLTVEEQRFGDRLVLRLEGEIDISSAPRLNEALAAATASDADEVWVDLGGVHFIDSTGMSALLRATQELPASRRLAVICPAGPARRALELTGIAQLLALYSDRQSVTAGG